MLVWMSLLGSGKQFSVEADSDETVTALKEKVRVKLHKSPTDRIHLIHSGEWLLDERRLRECGIDGKLSVGVEFASATGQSLRQGPSASINFNQHHGGNAYDPQMSMAVGTIKEMTTQGPTMTTQHQHPQQSKQQSKPNLDVKHQQHPIGPNRQIRHGDNEPTGCDDIFEWFRYLGDKYQRICTAGGKQQAAAPTPPATKATGTNSPRASAVDHRFSFSMSYDQLSDLDRLFQMGFRRALAVQVFVACEMRIVNAVNVLLQEPDGEEE